MTELQPEIGGYIRNIRRFVAFSGIFFILVSQFLIFASPADDDVIFPSYTWLAVLGVVVFIASYLIHPTLFFQRISTWPVFQTRFFWVILGFCFLQFGMPGKVESQSLYAEQLNTRCYDLAV